MQSIGSFKQGDTLSFYADVSALSGTEMTGVAAKLKCQIRTYNDKLMAEMVVTEWLDPQDGEEGHTTITGRYLFACPVSTQAWADGQYYTDIQYTDGDTVTSTDTFTLELERDVTHA